MELSGILVGTGAKMKADVLEDSVVFRGAVKEEVAFEDLVAQTKGTLLELRFGEYVVELGAGAKAAQLAAKIRSPRSFLDRAGVAYGQRAAVVGLTPAFARTLGERAVLQPGIPKTPVEHFFVAIQTEAQLESLERVKPLVGAGGTLWIVLPKASNLLAKVPSAAKKAGLRLGDSMRFDAESTAVAVRT